jgi:hypothetical protein
MFTKPVSPAFVVLFLVLSPGPAAGLDGAARSSEGGEGTPGGTSPASPSACFAPSTSAGYLLHTYPRRLGTVAKESYSGFSLLALAVAGGLVPWLDDYDGEVRSEVLEHRPRHGVIEAGEALGSPPALFGASLAIAAAGCLTGSEEGVATGATILEALSVAGVSTIGLKLAVHRRRPDGSDHLSFPSNHASGSFAFATVLARRHGWRLGVPAFLAAGFVSWARMAGDKHFLTDTLFGAALGSAVGLAAAREQSSPAQQKPDSAVELPRSSLAAVVPIVFADGGGVAMAARW